MVIASTFLQRSTARREQAVLGQKLDHQAIEQPGLLDLAGMSSPGQDVELAARNARLQSKRALMGRVLAAAEDDGGAGDAGLVVRGIRLRVRLELADDGCEIAM